MVHVTVFDYLPDGAQGIEARVNSTKECLVFPEADLANWPIGPDRDSPPRGATGPSAPSAAPGWWPRPLRFQELLRAMFRLPARPRMRLVILSPSTTDSGSVPAMHASPGGTARGGLGPGALPRPRPWPSPRPHRLGREPFTATRGGAPRGGPIVLKFEKKRERASTGPVFGEGA